MEAERQDIYTGRQFGALSGHNDWVTKICVFPSNPNQIITSSRDKSVIIWELFANELVMSGKMKKSLIGHDHFVTDCSLSKDGGFLITSSWDRTLRLWDIQKGVTKRTFLGHTNDVMCVAFSSDNRQIISGSRDRTVRLWNTLAVQKYAFEKDGHQDCVSSVQAVPSKSSISILSAGHDGVVKNWELSPVICTKTYHGHSGAINSMSVSPNYTMLVSGGRDGAVNLWKLDNDRFVKRFEAGGPVSCVSFNPRFFFFAVGVGSSVQLYNIKSESMYQSIEPLDNDYTKAKPQVVTFSWSNDGTCLFVGYTDGRVRMFGFTKAYDTN
ncbi:Guanine nucleotide-binding protein subunit beta-like protein [Thelohanellus kitauei]|uniref:Small ribosomal subunit protein RACK1 n=1 Tax=Thelohanellus kitauei TaxID=669202 RepID=A0A0C2MKQ2_THEKT|nr:Guanine nucleotide-binding protein subunit beta-like protein [Thelohanellus kitauei]